jgi:hypothetical protein
MRAKFKWTIRLVIESITSNLRMAIVACQSEALSYAGGVFPVRWFPSPSGSRHPLERSHAV